MAQYTWPAALVTVNNSANGTNGAVAPTASTQVGGIGPDGNLHPISTDNSGQQNVNVIASALPTGGATSAKQDTGNTSLASIDTKTPALVTGRVPVDGSGVTQPVSAAALPLPTGAATSALQTSGGQKTQVVDASGNVLPSADVVARALFAKLTDGTNTGAVKAASTAPAATDPALVVTISPNTADPAIGSVAAGVAGSKSYLTGGVFNTAFPTLTTGQQSAIQLDSSGRQIIAPLANTSIVKSQLQDNAGTAITVGQKTMSASVPVVLSSDQSALSVGQKGRTQANAPVYNLYSTTNVTTSAYVQLVASTTAATTFVDIFDSSGQAMILATGAAASEVILAYIPPGGLSTSLSIAAGTRVSVKALTANATSGYLLVNFWG